MKKLLTLLIIALSLTFLGIIAASAQQIKFDAGTEMSYHIGSKIGIQTNTYGNFLYKPDNLSILTQLRLRSGLFELISNTTIYEELNSHYVFSPHLAIFNIKLVADRGKFRLSAGHTCIHPICTSGNGLRDRELGGGETLNISISYNIK